jgi:hypothetical protein
MPSSKVGGVPELQVVVAAQDDEHLVVRIEAVQRLLQVDSVVDGARVVRRRERVLQRDVSGIGSCSTPLPISAGVDDDALEPGIELRVVTKAVPLAPGRDESVVDGILRLEWVTQDHVRKPVAWIEAPLGEAAEGSGARRCGRLPCGSGLGVASGMALLADIVRVLVKVRGRSST